MLEEISSSYLAKISDLLGTTEPALKLLLTVLGGYPLALIYRKYVYGKDAYLQHIYFILTGFLLGYWNYGMDMFHCVFTIFFTYCTLLILKGTMLCVAVTFIFNMSYLLIGYFYTSTDTYDIIWTMPQCILALRLIGTAYDYYDGHQPHDKLSADSKKVALVKRPELLEIFGHSFFPAACLIGPQFPMKRYQEFVAGNYGKKDAPNCPPDSVDAAVKRFTLGVVYLAIFQVFGMFVSDEYLLTDQFQNLSFFRKMLLLGIWGRYTLYKYISCWLIAEGACILFGITYTGENEHGEAQWNGLENIKISIFENTTEFNHYIQSFNVNTNHWVAHYVYKRLKFLGNRQISQLAALLFLSVWHGLHSGYYVCFFFEFLVIHMERDIKSIVKSNAKLSQFFSSPKVQLPLQILLRVYTFVFMGWCLLPFSLLQFDRYWKAFRNVNCVGIILFGLWPVVYSPILRFALKGAKRD
ncbi:lysophospholipid acyltransferase 5 isoform X1 [Anoplophora glabripennis]|uniref:lysophospholipid acyltransferase 5 isoform X1 n=1 Tax=Anoplophora glabripennis TaxID=217634 RepID=UPI000874D5B5|nr:lysophospholipid acyltransferase 5 isoform X1 [Anoplophora glabripennis]